MLFTYWDVFRAIFDWVPQSAAIMMLLCGFMTLSWLIYEGRRRGSFIKRKSEGEVVVTLLLKIISFLGLILGVFVIWSGLMSLILDIPPSAEYALVTENGANHFTSIFLIVIGFAIFFKPIKDLPLSSILGLLAGAAVALVVALLVPDWAVQWIGNHLIDPKWILVIIFIIVAVVVALTAKFYIGTLQKISKFLSWPPIALVLMIFCFAQGIALLFFGKSIFGLNLL
ncbi:MAG: hypothetical protein ACFFBI_01470 [Promethearchaeota archaeon]